MGYETLTAAAGQFSAIGLFNPANSGVDIVLDYVAVQSAAAQLVEFRVTNTFLANVGTKATQFRDTTPGGPLGQVRFESLAASILGGGALRIVTSTIILPLDWRFNSGAGIVFCSQAAASNLIVTFFAREIAKPYRTT